MGYSDKYLLVKKAAKIDLDTDRGYVEFLKIAKENGLTKERLEYYMNAYEASGELLLRKRDLFSETLPKQAVRSFVKCDMRILTTVGIFTGKGRPVNGGHMFLKKLFIQ